MNLLFTNRSAYEAGNQGIVAVDLIYQFRAEGGLTLLFSLISSKLGKQLFGEINNCKEMIDM